jgi:hypothetical protein
MCTPGPQLLTNIELKIFNNIEQTCSASYPYVYDFLRYRQATPFGLALHGGSKAKGYSKILLPLARMNSRVSGLQAIKVQESQACMCENLASLGSS